MAWLLIVFFLACITYFGYLKLFILGSLLVGFVFFISAIASNVMMDRMKVRLQAEMEREAKAKEASGIMVSTQPGRNYFKELADYNEATKSMTRDEQEQFDREAELRELNRMWNSKQ